MSDLHPLPCGDGAVEYRLGQGIDPWINARVHELDRMLRTDPFPGLIETIAAYDSLLAVIEPGRAVPPVMAMPAGSRVQAATTHEIPVLYGGRFGPDLQDVAEITGLSQRRVIDLHSRRTYPVYCIGFSPGFSYLGGLDPRLACPRLATPRTAVPPGSVAIGGSQTGIYPLPSPGGWRLIGRTSRRLFSPAGAVIGPGDLVRFIPVSHLEFDDVPDSVVEVEGRPGLKVLSVHLATIQDRGRTGYRRWGVGMDGALDQLALSVVNLVVGNPVGAAAIELFSGSTLRAMDRVCVAAAGAELWIDGRAVVEGRSAVASPGQTLQLSPPTRSTVSYLAVAGGIDVPMVMGSRSTNSAGAGGGYRGRPLAAGDILPVGEPVGPVGELAGRGVDPDLFASDLAPVRVLCGPDAMLERDWPRLGFTVSTTLSRTGARLSGNRVTPASAGIVSSGVVPGTVQLPGDGHPIILFRGGGTLGGYARPLTVISADLDRLTAFVPGSRLRFEPVSVSEAEAAAEYRRRLLSQAMADIGIRAITLRIGDREHAVTVEEL